MLSVEIASIRAASVLFSRQITSEQCVYMPVAARVRSDNSGHTNSLLVSWNAQFTLGSEMSRQQARHFKYKCKTSVL